MRILNLRTTPTIMNLDYYNLQEVGLAKALVRKGHQCDVGYYCGKEKDHVQTVEFDGKYAVRILWLHGYGMYSEGIYPSLRKYVKEYDIIQVDGYIGIMSWWLNRYFQQKAINYQGHYYYAQNKGYILKTKIWDRVLLPFSNKKNMIVVTKSPLATKYVKSKGIDDVTTIGVGLDLDNLMNPEEDIYGHEFIRELSLGKNAGSYLLYIGTINPARNILFLLDVFGKICQSDKICKLILIGKGDESYVAKCYEKMRELGIEDRVIYRPQLEQQYLRAVYELSDVFLFPTSFDIFGMVLLEAMYFGLCVFTTYNGGSSMLITKDNGFVIPELNAAKWAEEVGVLLNNPAQRKIISENASKTVRERFTWDALADQFLSVYRRRLSNIAESASPRKE